MDRSEFFSTSGLKAINIWHEITLICVLIMEISWTAPWFLALTPTTARMSLPLVYLNFLIVIWMANILMRLLNSWKIKEKFLKWIFAVFLISSIIISIMILVPDRGVVSLQGLLNRPVDSISEVGDLIPPEFLIGISCLFLAYRGINLAREWAGRDTIFTSIKRGIGMFIAYVIIITSFTGESPEFLPYVFLCATLFGMVASRIDMILSSSNKMRTPFDHNWIGGISVAILAILSLSLGLAVLLSGQIGRILHIIRLFIYAIVIIFAAPILILLDSIEPTLEAVRDSIPTPTPVPTPTPGELITPDFGGNILSLSDSSSQLGGIIRLLALVVVMTLIGYILLIRIKRWQGIANKNQQEDRESIDPDRFNIRLILNEIFGRLISSADKLVLSTKHRMAGRLFAAARIRYIYSSLLSLAAELGYPRPDPATPVEFLSSLHQLFPDQHQELNIITNGYMTVRYGEIPETHRQVEEVESAWEIVREQGKKLKTSSKNGTSRNNQKKV